MTKLYSKLIWLFFMGIFILFTHPFEGTGDFYHHVNTGRYIVEHKSLPYLDEFTHTANSRSWVAHSWASGVLFYLLLERFGEVSITIFTSLIALLTFVLLFLLLRTYKVSKKASLVTMALAAPPILTRWPQRPELFTYPLVLSILLIDSQKDKHPRLVFLYPLLMLLWANLYGSSVLLGILLMGFLIAKQLLLDFITRPSSHHPIFYISSFLAILTSFFNGYGFKTIFYYNLFIPKVSVYEGEWAGLLKLIDKLPPGYLITQQYYILIYLLYLTFFLLTFLFFIKRIKGVIFLTILSLAIFVPFFAFRQTPLATLLSVPLLATILTHYMEKKPRLTIAFTLPFVIVTLAISFWVNPPSLTPPSNIAKNQLIDFVKSNNLEGKAFNHSHFGGFLTYKLFPKVLVFFDTRDDLFTDSPALKDLYQVFQSGRSVTPLLEKYKIDLVIADFLTDGLNYKDLFYSLDWAPVYLSDRYFIAVPKKLAIDKNLPILNMVDPFSQTGAKPGLEEQALDYYQALLQKNPDSLNNKLFLASSQLALKKYDDVIKTISNLPKDQDRLIASLLERDRNYILAESYLGKKDCLSAKVYLDKVKKPIGIISIFKPNIVPASKINKGLAFYYLICQKDSALAKKFLDHYLSQTDTTPLEKLRVEKEFEEEVKEM